MLHFLEGSVYINCKWVSEVAQSCLTLCDTVDCSPAGSSIHGILQARILEWVAISFSRGSSLPRDWTQISHIAGRFFSSWAKGSPKDLLAISPDLALPFAALGNQLSTFCLHKSIDFLILNISNKWNHATCGVWCWLLSCSMSSKSIYAVACNNTSFLFMVK